MEEVNKFIIEPEDLSEDESYEDIIEKTEDKEIKFETIIEQIANTVDEDLKWDVPTGTDTIFIQNVREKWKDLVFRNVESVNKKKADILPNGVTYYYYISSSVIKELRTIIKLDYIDDKRPLIDIVNDIIATKSLTHKFEIENLVDNIVLYKIQNSKDLRRFENTVQQKIYKNIKEATENVPNKKLHSNFVVAYKKFFGQTSKKHLNTLDPYPDENISFNSSNFAELNFGIYADGKSTTPTLTFFDHQATNVVPRDRQLVCGIVKKSQGQYYYDKWFLTSSQFYNLWLMLFDPSNSTLVDTKYRQIASLNTRKIWNLYNFSISDKSYVHRVYETPAMFSSNLYETIANFCFRQSYINKIRTLIEDRELQEKRRLQIKLEAEKENIKFVPIQSPISIEEKLYYLLSTPLPQSKVTVVRKPKQIPNTPPKKIITIIPSKKKSLISSHFPPLKKPR